MLEVTGFGTVKELYENTNELERYFLARGIEEQERYEAEKLKSMMRM